MFFVPMVGNWVGNRVGNLTHVHTYSYTHTHTHTHTHVRASPSLLLRHDEGGVTSTQKIVPGMGHGTACRPRQATEL